MMKPAQQQRLKLVDLSIVADREALKETNNEAAIRNICR